MFWPLLLTAGFALMTIGGFRQWGEDGETLCELGGTGTEGTEHMVTETLIRSMYAYWRKVMGA